MISFPALVHEAQGRVTSIAMFSKQLLAEGALEDLTWTSDRLRRINRAAAELQRVIDTVRRLTDDGGPNVSLVDVSALSTHVVRRLVERTPDFERSTVWIQSDIHLSADRDELEMLLENLLANAFKFSSRQATPEVRVTASSHNGHTVISVSDNGIGIAPEDAERIFEPFTRCHSAFEGTGVGLALVRHIVNRHEGRIWAQGEPGAGASFSFCLFAKL